MGPELQAASTEMAGGDLGLLVLTASPRHVHMSGLAFAYGNPVLMVSGGDLLIIKFSEWP